MNRIVRALRRSPKYSSLVDNSRCTCDDDAVTSRLFAEATTIGEQVHSLMLADERLMAVGLTLLASLASIAVAQHKPYLLMALPFALGVLFCFIEQQHGRILGLGGYKSVLEAAIARRTGVPVPAWETAIAPRLHRERAVMSLRALVVAFFIASAYAAQRQAVLTTHAKSWGHEQSTVYIILTAASIVVAGVASVASAKAARGQFETVAGIARASLLDRWVCPQHGVSGPSRDD
jgi:hypothetical protein